MKIHPTTNIVDYNRDNFIGDIEIGKYCAISANVVMQSVDHRQDYPCIQERLYEFLTDERFPRDIGKITVGNDVWIGRGATILKDVDIGDGAIVGAQAVVTKDVKPYEVVGGNPAKHIGWRIEDEKKREFMKDLEWWYWSKDKIEANKKFFKTNIKNHTVEELKKIIKDIDE